VLRDGENDPDAATLSGVLEGAKELFGANHRFTIADLVKRTDKSSSGVRDILLDVAGERGEINRKALGQYFVKRAGRIMNGMRIKRGPLNRQKTATWEIEMS
jgi:hypothetical protein